MSALSPRQMFLLDQACKPIVEAFGDTPYLVGSSVERESYRDVDVRLMLDDASWRHLKSAGDHVIEYLGLLIGNQLANQTGLPVDFQIQHSDEANEKHPGVRNPLGLRSLSNYRGDAHRD